MIFNREKFLETIFYIRSILKIFYFQFFFLIFAFFVFLLFLNIFNKMSFVVNEIKNLIIIDANINNGFLNNIDENEDSEEENSENEFCNFFIEFLKKDYKINDIKDFSARISFKYKMFILVKIENECYRLEFSQRNQKNLLLKKIKIEKEIKRYFKRFK